MEGHHQHHHHHHPEQQHISVNVDTSDRFPQWNIQETKDFLMIRAELDQNFMETKRNKILWEVISTKMKEKGYNRTPDQCKFKWKNLIARYKGYETMETEAMKKHFPFYDELQTIFVSRRRRMLWAEAEATTSASGPISKKKAASFSDDDEENEDGQGNKGTKRKRVKKAKNVDGNRSSESNDSLKKILKSFMKQQVQIEAQWREALEARENERKMKESEWRQRMKTLEKERIMRERVWMEREEQRRIREEARAEKRDALITALLDKLRREGDM